MLDNSFSPCCTGPEVVERHIAFVGFAVEAALIVTCTCQPELIL